MGKLADALRGVAMPEQTRRKIASLDQAFSDAEAEVQSLRAENLHLKAQVNPLQREVDQLAERVRNAEEKQASELTFNDHTGLYSDKAGRLFCPKCFGSNGQRSPLRIDPHRWVCTTGGHIFGNPDWRGPSRAITEDPGGGSWMR